jgi:hypothetical protein
MAHLDWLYESIFNFLVFYGQRNVFNCDQFMISLHDCTWELACALSPDTDFYSNVQLHGRGLLTKQCGAAQLALAALYRACA